jgi:hypothetical protein
MSSKLNWLTLFTVKKAEVEMKLKDYSKTNLFELNDLCEQGDQEALKEWKRRWEAPWPSMATSTSLPK